MINSDDDELKELAIEELTESKNIKLDLEKDLKIILELSKMLNLELPLNAIVLNEPRCMSMDPSPSRQKTFLLDFKE